jgi:rhodanese-related sulfurtransferase
VNHSEDFLRLANEAKQRIKEVSPEKANQLTEKGAIILVVREKVEFDEGHIEGAEHLSRGTLEMRINEVAPEKDALIVLLLRGRKPRRARR